MRLVYLLSILSLAACSYVPQSNESVVSGHTDCPNCAEWNAPHNPVLIYGNTYYVGTNGLSVILITSPEGHVLIDGALSESAPIIRANIEALGFHMEDIKLILNSHAHYDHAGGLAALQRDSGAIVAASPSSADVLTTGAANRDDPQYNELAQYPMSPIRAVRRLSDGETMRVGPLELTPHFTPGHTAGGTTWTWNSCEEGQCLRMVYADSLTAISEPGYRFSQSERYPSVLTDFAHSFAVVENLPCDILLTPHPGASGLFERIKEDVLKDSAACSRYADTARQRLAERLKNESAEPGIQ